MPTRSKRAEDRRILPDAVHQQMDDWVSTVIAKQQFGVFVAGQSLFTKSVGRRAGAVGDYALPNYDDYGRLMRCLQRLADAGRHALAIHCSRGMAYRLPPCSKSSVVEQNRQALAGTFHIGHAP